MSKHDRQSRQFWPGWLASGWRQLKLGWLGGSDPAPLLHIAAYYSYGTRWELEVLGRLLRYRSTAAADPDDSRWQNLRRMYRRFESDERPGLEVVASFQGGQYRALSDEEGYFRIRLPVSLPPSRSLPWVAVRLRAYDGNAAAAATARVLVPAADAEFGVISDIDDTIIQTGASSLWDMAANTLLQNEHTRLAFEDVPECYRLLRRGNAERAINPIFYVSNGPWNLFGFLTRFMRLNGMPAGPLMLRDYGIDSKKFIKDDQHKIKAIARILEFYPKLPFVLIGDSGEKDPEFYHQIVERYGGRIRACYIRDVSSVERHAEVRAIADQLAELGSEMLLVKDMGEVIRHAARIGLIEPVVEPD